MNIKKLLVRWLCSILPKKGKRTIFLTTLFMKLNNITPGNFKSMQEFNNELHIVEDIGALKVPCHLFYPIWKDLDLPIRKSEFRKEGFTDEEIYGISERIITMRSTMFKYGERSRILEDIFKIIKYTLSQNGGHLPTTVI